MEIRIDKLSALDKDDLFRFEVANRAYFEEMVPTRGDEYYEFDRFLERHNALLEEQSVGRTSFYLIRDRENNIVGRINLVCEEENRFDLGYRIGRDYTGMGVAKQALKLLIDEVKVSEIEEVHAKTTSNNIASQKVLEKSGFNRVGHDEECFSMNGEQVNFVYYSWRNA
ncbi:GNAT family N-acetyltransferase [Guptibacillus algicola]|uniref:GNAT family N-acetyltransferase n=1 Tax=Guptibacillus algicola TaxID=225844 RepID=UPI001CD63B43|nr:GNAT family N-acetyltransferase [Alkalihalobacillus algicola]MCA0987144.1 GNAT family N-acetyltransferase [Alkalihalobacillus algicola]